MLHCDTRGPGLVPSRPLSPFPLAEIRGLGGTERSPDTPQSPHTAGRPAFQAQPLGKREGSAPRPALSPPLSAYGPALSPPLSASGPAPRSPCAELQEGLGAGPTAASGRRFEPHEAPSAAALSRPEVAVETPEAASATPPAAGRQQHGRTRPGAGVHDPRPARAGQVGPGPASAGPGWRLTCSAAPAARSWARLPSPPRGRAASAGSASPRRCWRARPRLAAPTAVGTVRGRVPAWPPLPLWGRSRGRVPAWPSLHLLGVGCPFCSLACTHLFLQKLLPSVGDLTRALPTPPTPQPVSL